MAKIISSLPGSTGVLSKTSQLINDGETGISTYVELNDLSTVATTGDYNNLINIPIDFTPKVHTHNISDISGTKSEFNTSLIDGNFLFVGDVLNTPDATTTSKGVIKLAGDLAGTADAPTVPGLANKVDKVAGKSLIADAEIARLATLYNYTHPANHPPSIITQDASNRFVTDVEKTAWNAKQGSLGFTPENVANKSDSYIVSSTATYPNTKALVDGLGTKISGTLTTNRIPKSSGTKSIGDSSLNDNGSVVSTNLPIHANSFVKSIGSTNLLLASGSDITQASLPISTATQTALDLKANLASPALTGTPTAPTAPAGTNTTQIATTDFVGNAVSTSLSNTVTLTTEQTITARKKFTGDLQMDSQLLVVANGSNFAGITFLGNSSNVGSISSVALRRKNDKLAIMANENGGSQRFVLLDGANVTSSDKTFTFPNQTGTFAITNNPTPLTATSFIKSSTPATNILLAGGGDIAQNTAFNKNFGTTAGTVVEGNYPPAKDGTGATGTWGINISGTAASATSWGGRTADFVTDFGNQPFNLYGLDNPSGIAKPFNDSQIKSWLGLGTNAYTSTAYLPTNGNSLTTSRLRNFGDQINANALTGGGAMWNYGQNGAPSNTPSGFTWGSVFQFNSQDTDDLALQFANNINHNVTTPTRDLYFRSKNNLAWQDDWKKLWHDGNFNPANYLPLSGGTLSGAISGTSATFSSTVTATSYTATSLPVFENNAAASSLAVGQFYRTSTGVLMVKF